MCILCILYTVYTVNKAFLCLHVLHHRIKHFVVLAEKGQNKFFALGRIPSGPWRQFRKPDHEISLHDVTVA